MFFLYPQKVSFNEICIYYRVENYEIGTDTYELTKMTPMWQKVNHPLVFDSSVYRTTATHGCDVDKVYMTSKDIEILCVLKSEDY